MKFMETHEKLINSHLVDYFTENLWEKCLSEDLRSYIASCHGVVDEILQPDKSSNNNCALSVFLNQIQSIVSSFHKIVDPTYSFENFVENENQIKQNLFMKSKKSYEVEIFTNVVSKLDRNEKSIIVDAGAGKAYLSLQLCYHYKKPVLAIESSTAHYHEALSYKDKLNKNEQHSTLVSLVLKYAIFTEMTLNENFVVQVQIQGRTHRWRNELCPNGVRGISRFEDEQHNIIFSSCLWFLERCSHQSIFKIWPDKRLVHCALLLPLYRCVLDGFMRIFQKREDVGSTI